MDKLPAPVMQAAGSTDCGLCAVQYILRRHGLDADIELLRSLTHWGVGGRQGNYPDDLVLCLMDHYGFDRMSPMMVRADAAARGIDVLGAVRRLLEDGWIGLVNRPLTAALGHYVVVDAIDEVENLLVTCSISGRKWWTREGFFAAMGGQMDWWLVRSKFAHGHQPH